MLSCDIMGFKDFFGTFAHEVAQTWFILHETLRTTLFGTPSYSAYVSLFLLLSIHLNCPIFIFGLDF